MTSIESVLSAVSTAARFIDRFLSFVQSPWFGWTAFCLLVAVGLAMWVRRPRADHESALDPALDGVKNLKKRWGFARRVLKAFPAFITPDRVTWARAPLLALALFNLLWGDDHVYAFWWTVYHEVCDFLDGGLADVRGGGTPYGEWLDPLMDKIATSLSLIVITAKLVLLDHAGLALGIGVLTGVSCWYAFWLTYVRWNRGSTQTAVKGTFAAKSPGKLKAVCEDIAVPALILGIAPGASMSFLIIGSTLLAASCWLARRSWDSQQTREPAAHPSPS